MRVETLTSTPTPEKVVCQVARGDYYDGFVPDTDFASLMESVEYDETHVDAVESLSEFERYNLTMSDETEYRMYALLERLFKKEHFGVWEHPKITLAIEGVSRACMAQLTRHRHATFDVQSQRYVDFSEKDNTIATPKSLVEETHVSRETGLVDVSEDEQDQLLDLYETMTDNMLDQYETMVEAGVPKEDARFMLPIGTTVNMSVSLNARALLHIANIREKADSQWEIRELTNNVVDEAFKDWMPMTYHIYNQQKPLQLAP